MPAKTDEKIVIRIMLAEDHAIVREGMASIIEREPDLTVVAQAANGAEAVRLFAETRPDITLMDLRMPVLDGAAAISQILAIDSAARIIVLTVHDGDEYIYRALKSGALGYLLKDTPIEELFDAIRAVANGDKQIPPEIAQKLAERVFEDELTAREAEVLHLMVEGLSNQQIAERLFVSEGTIKYHINHIYSKLGVSDRAGAIIVALKRGFTRF